MVGLISAVRLCHDRENGFWDADAHCYGCRVSLCACDKTYPLAALHWCLGMPFLVLTASFDPAAFFSSSWKKEEETWGTYSVTLPARRPFCAALGKASFPCRVGQGPPFTHLGVRFLWAPIAPAHEYPEVLSLNRLTYWRLPSKCQS